MHVFILFVPRCCIALSSKSGEALFEYIHSQRIITGHKHVDSEIKLVAIDEEGVWNVLGNDATLALTQLAPILHQIDSFSLRT